MLAVCVSQTTNMGMHNNTCGGGAVNGGVGGGGDMMSYATHTPAAADDYYGGASGLVADYDLPQCLGGRPPLEPAYAAECYYEKNASAADYRSYYGGDGAYDQLAADVGGGSYHAHHQHHHHHHQHHHQHGHHNHQHPLQSAEAAVIITSSDGLSYTNLDCNGIAAAVHGQEYGAYSDDGGGGGGGGYNNGYGGHHHRDENGVRNESYCGGGGASVDNAFFNMHLNHNNDHSTRPAVQQPRPPSAQPPPAPVQPSAQTAAAVAAVPLQLQATPTSGDDRCTRVIKQEASSGGQCYGGRDGTSPYSDDASAYRATLIAGQPQQHVQQQHHHHIHHQQQQQQQQQQHHQHHQTQQQQQQHCGRQNSGGQQKHGAAAVAASSAVQTAVPTYKWMQVKRNVPKPAAHWDRWEMELIARDFSQPFSAFSSYEELDRKPQLTGGGFVDICGKLMLNPPLVDFHDTKTLLLVSLELYDEGSLRNRTSNVYFENIKQASTLCTQHNAQIP
ncbi:homeotic protein labial-like [Aphis craccivora]|uniref:Homeotic protein labial-like n=1 Tax=Aphis craccivora TaxID=307492 RepID=A0A6G0YYD7_APHCR|nr:homeotic protein labial-like [Aphis craccivora]